MTSSVSSRLPSMSRVFSFGPTPLLPWLGIDASQVTKKFNIWRTLCLTRHVMNFESHYYTIKLNLSIIQILICANEENSTCRCRFIELLTSYVRNSCRHYWLIISRVPSHDELFKSVLIELSNISLVEMFVTTSSHLIPRIRKRKINN